MNTLEIEERVRAATRAAGDTVAPDSVPPLRLPSQRSFRLLAGWHGSARWLAPVAAAAAVIAVAVVMVAVGRNVGGHGTVAASPPGPVQTGPPISSYVASGQVPKYYLSIESSGNPNFNPSYAVVRESATGNSPGEWTAASGQTVVAVTAAADDRTFIADVQPWANRNSSANQSFEPRTFYTLTLNRTSGIIDTVSRLPMSVPAGQLMTGFALSADGTELAIAVQPDNNKREPDLTQVKVFTLATGAVRTWTANGTIGFGPDDAKSLSWTDDKRTLAFDWTSDGPGIHTGIRLLNVAASGGSLLADSREAVTLINQAPVNASISVTPGGSASAPSWPASLTAAPLSVSSRVAPASEPALTAAPTCQQDAIITPDGSRIVCGAIAEVNATFKPGGGGLLRGAQTEYLEWSVATGQVTRTLGQWTFGSVGALSVGVLWSNASGSLVIGQIPNGGAGPVGVISGNEFSPLPRTFTTGAW